MKIAIVSPYPLHTSGGVQRHILDYHQQLKKRGYYVRLFSPSLPEEIILEDHITFGKSKAIKGGKILTNGSETYYTWVRGKYAVLPEEFDIVHIHEPLHPAFFYGLTIARNNKAKKIAHIHAYNPFLTEIIGFVSKPVLNRIIKNFDYIIASSKVSAAAYADSSIPLSIIPNGVEISKLGPDKPKIKEYLDGKKNIMFLGRSDERKGLKYLLKAWPKFIEKYGNNVRLIIAGGRSEEEVNLMQSWAAELPKCENIVFEGGVSEERKASLFATADVFAAPSTGSESFGMILNESMASGTPVVAFNNPGYRIVLEGKEQYCLATLFDVEDLTNKVIRILEDERLRDELIAWGFKEVRGKYDWNIVAEQILGIYAKVLAKETVNS